MKTFLFNSLNRFRRYSEELDTMAEIRKCLCDKAWQVFNNSGDKEVYIFQEDGRLIISINGNITRGSWQYLSVNNSIAISASNQEYMVHPAFLDNILFALQVDGTENYAFLIDQKNAQNFAPKSLDDLHQYFRQKEQKRIEEENRKREEQRLAELKRIEEANRIREEQRLAEQKRIEEEQKERAERERREKEQREEEQKEREAKKIYKDEIIKSRLLCYFFNSKILTARIIFVFLLSWWCFYILFLKEFQPLAIIFWGYLLPLFIVLFLFILDIPFLIFRYRLEKFIKNNKTYSTDVLYRLVAYYNEGHFIYNLSYNKFKKLVDKIPTNEIHYETVFKDFLPFSFSGVRILSHFHFDTMIIVRFDKDVTEIGDGAFSCTDDLTHITIPPSVTKIGHNAFQGCSRLSDITIPPSVRTIGYYAFDGCSSLWGISVSKDNKVYDSREDCNAIIHTESNMLIRGCKKTIIPPSVTEIGEGAFSCSSILTSISIPASVTKIGDIAFFSCSILKRITIPESVTEIGRQAFSHCSSLWSITVSKDNKVYDSREDCNAIIHTESNTLIRGCKKTIIPPSVTEIGWYAFEGCSSLTSISIPPSVTEIGWNAFRSCSNLTEVRIPKDCNVSKNAFEDCPNVKIIRY